MTPDQADLILARLDVRGWRQFGGPLDAGGLRECLAVATVHALSSWPQCESAMKDLAAAISPEPGDVTYEDAATLVMRFNDRAGTTEEDVRLVVNAAAGRTAS